MADFAKFEVGRPSLKKGIKGDLAVPAWDAVDMNASQRVATPNGGKLIAIHRPQR